MEIKIEKFKQPSENIAGMGHCSVVFRGKMQTIACGTLYTNKEPEMALKFKPNGYFSADDGIIFAAAIIAFAKELLVESERK